jgi:hypothetical protein
MTRRGPFVGLAFAGEAKVQASKFRQWPKFGCARVGHTGLQGDHAGTLGFRNIRIRELT